MFTKMKATLRTADYYKIAIIIICLNSAFEIVFQYRFQSDMKMEVVYFLIFGAISISAIKKIGKGDQKRVYPVFYSFWPIVMSWIYFFSCCKISLFPMFLSSFVLFFWGRHKRRLIKISAAAIMAAIALFLAVLIIPGYPFFVMGLTAAAEAKVIKTVSSVDNRYIMVLEETDMGALGGDVSIYLGRKLDFGPFGRYIPRGTKYYGHWGERPEFDFIGDHEISINGEFIEKKGNTYLSNNELNPDYRQLDDDSAEGGEAARYRNDNGDEVFFTVTMFGETGRVKETYYLLEEEAMYYTRLEERYRSPVSLEPEPYITSKTQIEGTIVDGHFIHADMGVVPSQDGQDKAEEGVSMYSSPDELKSIFAG